MAHTAHLIENVRIGNSFDSQVHCARAHARLRVLLRSSTHSPASPYPRGRASTFGWRPANHRGAGNGLEPIPSPSPTTSHALVAACELTDACALSRLVHGARRCARLPTRKASSCAFFFGFLYDLWLCDCLRAETRALVCGGPAAGAVATSGAVATVE